MSNLLCGRLVDLGGVSLLGLAVVDGRRGHQADPGVANVCGSAAALAALASPPAHALTNARATTRLFPNESDAVDNDASDRLVSGQWPTLEAGEKLNRWHEDDPSLGGRARDVVGVEEPGVGQLGVGRAGAGQGRGRQRQGDPLVIAETD